MMLLRIHDMLGIDTSSTHRCSAPMMLRMHDMLGIDTSRIGSDSLRRVSSDENRIHFLYSVCYVE